MPTSKGENEVLITVAINEQLKNQVRSQAALQGRTFKDVLHDALQRWLKDARRTLRSDAGRPSNREKRRSTLSRSD
jgi:hypothetical protein